MRTVRQQLSPPASPLVHTVDILKHQQRSHVCKFSKRCRSSWKHSGHPSCKLSSRRVQGHSRKDRETVTRKRVRVFDREHRAIAFSSHSVTSDQNVICRPNATVCALVNVNNALAIGRSTSEDRLRLIVHTPHGCTGAHSREWRHDGFSFDSICTKLSV